MCTGREEDTASTETHFSRINGGVLCQHQVTNCCLVAEQMENSYMMSDKIKTASL